MPKGGARPGAGRKPGLQAEAYRKTLIELIEKNRVGLAKALVDKGLSGDVPALKEINERALGKVAQPLTGAEGKDLFPMPILTNMDVPANHSNQEDSPAPKAT
jgi:hypothetical protein